MLKPRLILPPSFKQEGYVTAAGLRPPGVLRGLMVGTDGLWDTGKTEFALSAPGPGVGLFIDRGYLAVLDNAFPPESRRLDEWVFKVIQRPLATQLKQEGYAAHWTAYRDEYVRVMSEPLFRTVLIDGDSDSWELQRLAAFGKLDKVPPTLYDNVNAARRALYTRAFDSGKITIFTNRVRDEYEEKTDPETGKWKSVKTGNVIRQGFSDQNYLFALQIRHLAEPAGVNKVTGVPYPPSFGIRIMKCKANLRLVGMELWGSDCNFKGLVKLVYPQISLQEWGYPEGEPEP